MRLDRIHDELQIASIKKLAEEKRCALGFVGATPIASEIFNILDKLEIILLEYPIESDREQPSFCAALMYSKQGEEELVFIGLNTAIYFDKQIYAIAHELYHFFTKTGSQFGRVDREDDLVEVQANYFAEEFLLPERALTNTIIEEFRSSSLRNLKMKTLLRFIARLQCTWWLPYDSIIARLKQINAINENQYLSLFSIDPRDMNGEYGKVGLAVNKEIFIKLNSANHNINASPKSIEIIVRNFENNLIDEDDFADILSVFEKHPSDFGYDYTVSEDDLDEFDSFFNGR